MDNVAYCFALDMMISQLTTLDLPFPGWGFSTCNVQTMHLPFIPQMFKIVYVFGTKKMSYGVAFNDDEMLEKEAYGQILDQVLRPAVMK